MTDDGVRVHGDGDKDEVRSDPCVSGVSREERDDQVTGNRTASADRESDNKVLELRPRQAPGACPLGDQDSESREPGHEKVRCEDRIERAGLSSGANRRHCYVLQNQSGRQREDSKRDADR